MTDSDNFKYWCFISYSHQDQKWGSWLHRGLETYRVPKRLVGRATRDGGAVPARIMPVFRDREELPTATDLGEAINRAMEQSRYLVVICSPRSAKSKWVNEEILAFKRMGRANRILALIVDGEPNAVGKAEFGDDLECFPEALKYEVNEATAELSNRPTEPIAADVRAHANGKSDARLKLVAGILGVGFDELRQREQKRRRQRTVFALCFMAGLVVAFSTLAMWAFYEKGVAQNERSVAENAKNEERAQRAIAEQRYAFGLVSQGNALLMAKRMEEAKDRFEEGMTRLQELDLPTLAAEVGLWDYHTRSLQVLHALDHAAGKPSEEAPSVMELEDRNAITDVAISNDERRIISTAGRVLNVWDAGMGRLLRTLEPESSPCRGVSFLDDHLIFISADGTLRIWDVEKGVEVAALPAHAAPATSRPLALAPAARLAISGGKDGILKVWDIDKRKTLRRLEPPHDDLAGITMSSDGQVAISWARDDAALRVWEVKTGKLVRTLKSRAMSVYDVSLSRDGSQALSVGLSTGVVVWDVGSGRERRTLSGHQGEQTHAAATFPSGDMGLSGGDDQTMRLWNIASGTEIAVLNAHVGHVRTLAISANARLAVSGGDDGLVKIWVRPAEALRPFLSNRRPLPAATSTAFSPDGRLAVSCHFDEVVRLWDVATGFELKTHQVGRRVMVHKVSFTPDGSAVLLASDRGLRLWPIHGGKSVEVLGPEVKTTSVAVSRAGRFALSGDDQGQVRIWDIADRSEIGQLQANIAKKQGVYTIAVSPDGSHAATVSVDMTLKAWRLSDGECLWSVSNSESSVMSAAFTTDGGSILSGDVNGRLDIRDARNGNVLGTLKGHTAAITQVDVFPDGRYSLSASADRSWRIWDLKARREVHKFGRPHWQPIYSVAVSPDGRRVISAGQDLIFLLWDLGLAQQSLKLETTLDRERRTITEHPDDPTTLATLAERFSLLGWRDWALEYFERSQKGRSAPPALKIGTLRWRSLDLAGAYRAYERASKNHEAPKPYLQLCMHAMVRMGMDMPKPETRRWAVMMLAQQENPVSETMSALVGMIGDQDAAVRSAATEALWRLRGDLHETAATKERAIGMAYLIRSEDQLKTGEPPEKVHPMLNRAIELLSRVTALEESNLDDWTRLGEAYHARGRTHDAIATFREALKRFEHTFEEALGRAQADALRRRIQQLQER